MPPAKSKATRVVEHADIMQLYKDYLVLAEKVHQRFLDETPLTKATVSIGEQIEKLLLDTRPSDLAQARTPVSPEEKQRLRAALATIDGAYQHLAQLDYASAPAALLERERERTKALVNEAFSRSHLFTLTKWVLVVSLALVGAGSLSYAGFNLAVSDRMQSAQQRLSETTTAFDATVTKIQSQQKELEDKQTSAVDDLKSVIQAKSQDIQNTLDAVTKDVASQADLHKKSMDDQLAGFDTAVGTATKAAEDKVMKFGDEQMLVVGQAAQKGIAEMTGKADDLTKNFAGDLGDEVDRQKNEIDKATTANIAALSTLTQQKLTQLTAQTDDQSKKIAAASADNIASLGTAAQQKSAELDQQFKQAVSDISAPVTQVENYADQFEKGVQARIDIWNDKMTTTEGQSKTLAANIADLQRKLDDVSGRLDALQKNSGAALQVADRLSAATNSGQLSLIGAALEKSVIFLLLGAVLIVLALGAAIVGLARASSAGNMARRALIAHPADWHGLPAE
jgi:hypothetical protein